MRGRFVGRGWNGAGYINPEDVRLNPQQHPAPQAFNLEIEGQLLASHWEWGWARTETAAQWHPLPHARVTTDGRYRRDRYRHPLFVLRNNGTREHFIGPLAWSTGCAFEFDLDADIGTADSSARLAFRAGHGKDGIMQAVVYHGPGDIRYEERPEPVPQGDNLVVKVLGCAICGTDLKLATIGNPRCHPPRIIGHEMVGEIVHAGADVQGFAAGERITLATTLACGACPYCARDLGNLCPNARPISYDFDGAFADFVAVPPMALAGGNVIKVPAGVPDDDAALSEPLSCAINAQELAGVAFGDRVLIVGGGPLGALHAEVAKALGAADVMIVQRSEPRLSFLRKLRGVRVVDGAAEDVAAVVKERTGGLGADAVIVCAPSREAQEQAVALARKGGAVSLFASLPKGASDITLDSRLIHYGELHVVGASDSRPEHVRRAVQMMAEGQIDWERLITHRLPLAEIHAGLRLMQEKQSLKVMVYPGG